MKAEAPALIGRVLLLVEDADGLAAATGQRPDVFVVDVALLAGRQPAGLSAPLWARIRPAATGCVDHDLDVAFTAGAAGILAGSVKTIAEVERLGVRLAVREAEHGLPDGSLRILAGFGDDPAGILAAERLAPGRLPRLAGLVCDPARLADALGCPRSTPIPAAAEARLLLAAAACHLPAITVVAADRPAAEAARAAREAGFSAVVARNSLELPKIWRAFEA